LSFKVRIFFLAGVLFFSIFIIIKDESFAAQTDSWLDQENYIENEPILVLSRFKLSCGSVSFTNHNCASCDGEIADCPCFDTPAMMSCKEHGQVGGYQVLEFQNKLVPGTYFANISGYGGETNNCQKSFSVSRPFDLGLKITVETDKQIYASKDQVKYKITNLTDKYIYILEGCFGDIIRYSVEDLKTKTWSNACEAKIPAFRDPGPDYVNEPKIELTLEPNQSIERIVPLPDTEEAIISPFIVCRLYKNQKDYLEKYKGAQTQDSMKKTLRANEIYVVVSKK